MEKSQLPARDTHMQEMSSMRARDEGCGGRRGGPGGRRRGQRERRGRVGWKDRTG